MKIPTNEVHLRENLHEAVESLSLVNIIILLVLIRAVQVISWLRPSERDIKALPDPSATPATPGLDSQLPPLTCGTLRENYPQIASISAGSGPETDSGGITVQDTNGRDWTFQEWMEYQRRSAIGEAEHRAATQEADEIWNGNPNARNAFPGLLSEAQRELLHWEHVGVDYGIGQSRHRPYQTTAEQGTPMHLSYLAWAVNDCNERLIMIAQPDGYYRIETAERLNLDPETPIEAPQYYQAELENFCNGHNRHQGFLDYGRNRAWGHVSGYCTPCRDGRLTGSFGVPAVSLSGPRNRATAEAYEQFYRQHGARASDDSAGGIDGTGPHIRTHKHNPDS